jgi:hypothetical protein
MKAWLALLALWPALVNGHALAPALLELRGTDAERYDVLWRTSVARVRGVAVAPVLPPQCEPLASPQSTLLEGEALETRWPVRCAGGIGGAAVQVAGLEGSGINVVLRIAERGGPVTSAVLDARDSAFIVPAGAEATRGFARYGALGIGHLLTGIDHVLFVLGLLAVVRGVRPLVVAVTAFTLGHSLTLAAATLGLMGLAPALAELGIALSLVAVALAMLRPREAPGLLARRPALLTFGFGLLHGLGFAGALAGIGLPQGEVVPALLAFNLGIEMGQLAVVAAALAAARLLHAIPAGIWSQRMSSRLAPAYIIGSLAVCWCIERTVALLA